MAAMIALLNPIIRKDIAVHFASNLGRTNERFDYNRFLNACGLEHIEADQAVAEYEEILKIQN